MTACDFCDERPGLISWQRLQPFAGQVTACEHCHGALAEAAAAKVRTRQDHGQYGAAADEEAGELWVAEETTYWFSPGSATTPTRANLRRVEVSVPTVVAIATR